MHRHCLKCGHTFRVWSCKPLQTLWNISINRHRKVMNEIQENRVERTSVTVAQRHGIMRNARCEPPLVSRTYYTFCDTTRIEIIGQHALKCIYVNVKSWNCSGGNAPDLHSRYRLVRLSSSDSNLNHPLWNRCLRHHCTQVPDGS